MACISKLENAITYDCGGGTTGLVSAIIINKADIESFTSSDSGFVSGLTLKAGASAYKIDTIKRSLVLSTSLKVNDGAPNAYSHSATIIDTGDREGNAGRNRARAFTNGSFVIIARAAGKDYGSVFGLFYGLSPSSVEYSTHDNGGWSTVVLSTPESAIGEDELFMSREAYNTLYATAV